MDRFLWRDGVLYSQSQFVNYILLADINEVILPAATACYQLHTGMYGGREFKDGKLIHGMVWSEDCVVRTYEQGRLLYAMGKLYGDEK